MEPAMPRTRTTSTAEFKLAAAGMIGMAAVDLGPAGNDTGRRDMPLADLYESADAVPRRVRPVSGGPEAGRVLLGAARRVVRRPGDRGQRGPRRCALKAGMDRNLRSRPRSREVPTVDGP